MSKTISEYDYALLYSRYIEASKTADMWERVAHDHESLCKSLKETNADLRRIIGERNARNAKLRELVEDMFEEIEDAGFDPLVERQGKRGSYYEEDPSWRVKIRERVRELGIEVDQ